MDQIALRNAPLRPLLSSFHLIREADDTKDWLHLIKIGFAVNQLRCGVYIHGCITSTGRSSCSSSSAAISMHRRLHWNVGDVKCKCGYAIWMDPCPTEDGQRSEPFRTLLRALRRPKITRRTCTSSTVVLTGQSALPHSRGGVNHLLVKQP